MSSPAGPVSSRLPSLLVLLAGVVAALHAGKIPPAVPALRAALDLTLIQAGFLISLMQIAGATAGLAIALATGSVGLRRSLIAGLAVLAATGLAGGFAQGATGLLVLRAVEGAGFLLVAMPAPALLRQLVPPHRLSRVLGIWGAYMPAGTGLALLVGPALLAVTGWRGWWWGLAGLALLVAVLAWRVIPSDSAQEGPAQAREWQARLGDTLRHRGPWLVALAFACYSGQWLAVVGFLPEIYAAAQVPASQIAPLTALAAAINIVGNVAAGGFLARGVAAHRLLWLGFGVMGLGALLAFLPSAWLSAEGRYLSILAFSAVGGLVPGTLFTLAVRFAPTADTIATTVGWVQQLSAVGQLAGPPLVAWIAAATGTWQWTGAFALAASAVGVLLASRMASLPSPAR